MYSAISFKITYLAAAILALTASYMSRASGSKISLGKRMLIFCGVFIGLISADAIVREVELLPYGKHVAEYTYDLSHAPPYREPTFIHGKLIMLKKHEGNYAVDDSTFTGLPKDLQPRIPEEIGTIAITECDSVPYGKYTDNTPGFIEICYLSVRDKATGGLMIDRQRFVGGPPPDTKYGSSGSTGGSNPMGEIYSFISTLPRKPLDKK